MMLNYKETYPLGSLLLDKENINYNDFLEILNKTQDILDDFLPNFNQKIEIPNSLAIFYLKDEDLALQDSLQNHYEVTQNIVPKEIEDFAKKMQEKFSVNLLDIDEVISVSGNFGAFSAELSNGEYISFGQGILFVSDENLSRYRGIYSVADFDNADILEETLEKSLGKYEYGDIISYDPTLCQYHHRREKHCTKCANVCPTFGVGANDSLMELVFSSIDCIACGACVGVCPTNCLDYEFLPKEGLDEIIELYENKSIFLCKKEDYDGLIKENRKLSDAMIPLILPSVKFLNENDFLNLLQTSGNDLVVFSKEPLDSLSFINNITQNRYEKHAIKMISSFDELQDIAINPFEKYLYKNRYNKSHRESFRERLRFLVKDGEYGFANSVGSILYGNMKIDANKCTMCMSCVGACNVNAIFAREDDFSLRYNASLCTTCGYCVDSCPENVLELDRTGISLNENYFNSKEMAKDEPFRCIECGKVFATKRSVDKIVGMLSVAFANDKDKLKTLQCCPDCKVRVMFSKNLGVESENKENIHV